MSSVKSKIQLPARTTEALVSRRKLLMATPALAGVSVAQSAAGISKTEAAATRGDRLENILKAGKLRVGTFLQYKPYAFKNPKGEPDGFDTDFAKALTADMGVRPEFVDNTWDGIIPALQADKFDIIFESMVPTAKRALVVDFTIPYDLTEFGFIFRIEDMGRFSSLEKFNDPKVTISILIQAVTPMPRFFPKPQLRVFNSAQEGVLAVETKKVDASVAELPFLEPYAKAHPGLSVKAIDYPGSTLPGAITLTPRPDNAHLMNFLNIWIQNFYWDGRAEALYKKWLPGMTLPKPDRYTAPL